MWQRLREAWRVFIGEAEAADLPIAADPECPRCAQLTREVDYWRMREERTADRLLESKGLAPVAIAPGPPPVNPIALAMTAMSVTEFDSTKTRNPDLVTAAGPDAMTRGHAH